MQKPVISTSRVFTESTILNINTEVAIEVGGTLYIYPTTTKR